MYVTECPYCGQRVRKRAPKLERGAEPDAVPRRRRPPWLVDARLAERRGDDRGNDLIGVAVIAAVLLLLPLADVDTSWAAGLGGAAAGAVIGVLISPLRR